MNIVIARFAQPFLKNRRAQAAVVDDDDSHLSKASSPPE
jgi:hypothetical protein